MKDEIFFRKVRQLQSAGFGMAQIAKETGQSVERVTRVAGQLADPDFLDDNWMRVAPGADAAIWRPWSRETGEL